MAAVGGDGKRDGESGAASESRALWLWRRLLYGLDAALADLYYQTLVRMALHAAPDRG